MTTQTKKVASKSVAVAEKRGKKPLSALSAAERIEEAGQTATVAPAPVAKGKGSALHLLRTLICETPSLSVDETIARLANTGHKLTRATVTTQRANYFGVVKVLTECGKLK
jgi:hypothetical protein